MFLDILLILLSFFIILPVMSIRLLDIKYLYFIIIFIYIIYKKEIKNDNTIYGEKIKLKKLIIAYLIDSLLLIVVCGGY